MQQRLPLVPARCVGTQFRRAASIGPQRGQTGFPRRAWEPGKISDAYWQFTDAEGFAKVMRIEDVLHNNGNLSVQLYVKQSGNAIEHDTEELIEDIKAGQLQINAALDHLFAQLKNIGIDA
ncbi:MAG: hypothetical protein ACR65O_06905 [Methylomicrobium sp.]